MNFLLFNHEGLCDVSSREWHQTTDVVEFHVGRQNSHCTFKLVSEKEPKTQQKRGIGKVCPVTALRGFNSELHTRSGLSVVIGMTWRAWASWRAAATDALRLVSSQYRLERLRADMTLGLKFWTQEPCVVLHFSVANYNTPQKNSWAVH